jgi:hypothetical protein
MTFADAKQILNGSPTVATDYFKGTITDTLVGHFNAILFAKSDLIDIDRYVVGERLDGLFVMPAKEERKIQTNPAARVTDLLKEVFAKTGSS